VSSQDTEHQVSRLQAYIELTKPGITRMIVLTAATGYYLAIDQHFEEFFSSGILILNFAVAMIGTMLTSAGSCVLNNVMEVEYDKSMKRTAKRALPSGVISQKNAFLYGILLSIIGAMMLFLWVNALTALLSVLTIASYVLLYTPLKRKTKLALYAGTLPGALPALGGWTAYTNTIDIPGLLLFGVLLFWQIPHFLALAWIYRIDYEQAGFKMHSEGGDSTGKRIALLSTLYALVGSVTALLLWEYAPLGFVYGIGVIALSLFFLYACLAFFKYRDGKSAKLQLYASYAYLSGIFLLVFVNKQL
jgi:protoheme IX farnesyltransferase